MTEIEILPSEADRMMREEKYVLKRLTEKILDKAIKRKYLIIGQWTEKL